MEFFLRIVVLLGVVAVPVSGQDGWGLEGEEESGEMSQEERRTWGPRWQVGFGGGPVIAVTEANGVDPTVGIRAMVRYRITRSLALELGGGFLHYIDRHSVAELLDVEGDAYPVDIRLVYLPHRGRFITPYAELGIGLSYYNADFPTTHLSPYHDHGPLSGTFLHIPVGVGLLVGTGIPGIDIDLRTTLNFGLTDNLNPNLDGQIDNIWQANIGPTFSFGSLAPPPPVDTDGDGLSDDMERELGTDPKSRDSDRDGIDDRTEIRLLRTDPLAADTDGDRLSDREEFEVYRSDPNRADSDGDGLPDGDEVTLYRSSPTKIDSDGDGLGDWEEIHTWRTDPVKVDTDFDGVTDAAEVQIHKTDPNNRDTDGGGEGDGEEIARGADPLDPSDDER